MRNRESSGSKARFTLACAIACLVACEAPPTESSGAAESTRSTAAERSRSGRTWGYLVWGHENHSFSTCEEDKEGWVVDSVEDMSLAELYSELATEPYAPVFFDIEGEWLGKQSTGFGEQYADTIEITRVYRAEREGWGCRLEIDELVFRGFGTEPGWHLEIREDGAVLTSMDGRLTWEGNGQIDKQAWVFGDAGQRMEARIIEQPCRDSMSGAWFSHQIEYELGSAHFSGCAVPGALGLR